MNAPPRDSKHYGQAISLDQVRKFLWRASIVLIGINVALSLLIIGGYHTPAIVLTNALINIGSDSSVLTWFSSLLLLACAVGLLVVRDTVGVAGRLFSARRSVELLSVVFVGLSIDEVAMIHERLGGRLAKHLIGEGSGVLFFEWVVVGIVFTGIIAAISVPLLIRLPGPTRRGFLVAGAVFVAGAIGVESINASVADRQSLSPLATQLMIFIEEILELVGVLMFLFAILRHIEWYRGPKVLLTFESASGLNT